jgi:hypothetical protein
LTVGIKLIAFGTVFVAVGMKLVGIELGVNLLLGEFFF